MTVGQSGTIVPRVSDLLPTHVIVSAARTSAQAAGAFLYVRQRGDADRGTLLLKLNDLSGSHSLHRQIWDGEKRRFERIAAGEESRLEELIASEAKFDRDLWIIEIEDRAGRLFFDTILHESAAI